MEDLGKFPALTALIAGILTFISPCVLPLIPSFISYITGASLEDLRQNKASTKKTFLKSVLFVAGFGTVFTLLGFSAGSFGKILNSYRDILCYVGGAIVIIFGLHTTGLLKIKFLYREFSFSGKFKTKISGLGAFFIGATFAFAWTPCVGPILASILLLASTSENAARGFWLLFIYSTGLGIPFILTGLFVNGFIVFFDFMKKYYKVIEIVSGIFLILVGLLIMTGTMTQITQFLLKFSA